MLITSSRIFDTQYRNAQPFRYECDVVPRKKVPEDVRIQAVFGCCIVVTLARSQYYLLKLQTINLFVVYSSYTTKGNPSHWPYAYGSGQLHSFDRLSAYCNFLLFHNFTPKRWCHFLFALFFFFVCHVLWYV